MHGVFYSTVNYRTKIPEIFLCLFGIILCTLKYLVICSTISGLNPKDFLRNFGWEVLA
jgi:hypothetical protein